MSKCMREDWVQGGRPLREDDERPELPPLRHFIVHLRHPIACELCELDQWVAPETATPNEIHVDAHNVAVDHSILIFNTFTYAASGSDDVLQYLRRAFKEWADVEEILTVAPSPDVH